jgi:hypothetical protein
MEDGYNWLRIVSVDGFCIICAESGFCSMVQLLNDRSKKIELTL